MRGATAYASASRNEEEVFQSTLLMRGATQEIRVDNGLIKFQSTLLMRGATTSTVRYRTFCKTFQSTLLMRGATYYASHGAWRDAISIHAPHARSDHGFHGAHLCDLISIHAPHARSDVMPLWNGNGTVFQSTLLMRGATERQKRRAEEARKFQSTLLMRGATRNAGSEASRAPQISIHAPHARSDTACAHSATRASHFNPRSSCEERLLSA